MRFNRENDRYKTARGKGQRGASEWERGFGPDGPHGHRPIAAEVEICGAGASRAGFHPGNPTHGRIGGLKGKGRSGRCAFGGDIAERPFGGRGGGRGRQERGSGFFRRDGRSGQERRHPLYTWDNAPGRAPESPQYARQGAPLSAAVPDSEFQAMGGTCPLCKNHCPLDAPGCPRGEAHARALRMEAAHD